MFCGSIPWTAGLRGSVNWRLMSQDFYRHPTSQSGTITPRADDIDLSGGTDGDVLTVQADGSLHQCRMPASVGAVPPTHVTDPGQVTTALPPLVRTSTHSHPLSDAGGLLKVNVSAPPIVARNRSAERSVDVVGAG